MLAVWRWPFGSFLVETSQCLKCTGMGTALVRVRRRADLLRKRRCSGPGGRGRRNCYTCDLAGSQGGPQQARGWTEHWADAHVPLGMAECVKQYGDSIRIVFVGLRVVLFLRVCEYVSGNGDA